MRRIGLVLILVLLAQWPSAADAAGKRIALVIGNNTYENITSLKKAVGDAEAVTGKLTEMGFTVVSAIDADRATMNRKLFEFTAQIERHDIAFFFFAGHGVRLFGRNYLLPTDVPKAEKGGGDLVADAAFAADAIRDRIRRRTPLLNIMVLDACRDNPFEIQDGAKTRTAFGETRGLARMKTPKGTFIMFSAGEGERALDRMGPDDEDPNSVFTRHMLQVIATPGATLHAIAKQLQKKVFNEASRIGHEQFPAYYDRVLDDFCLVQGDDGKCGVATAAAPAAPAPAPQVQRPRQRADRAIILKGNREFEKALRAKDTIAALEVFVFEHPNHPKTQEAENKLARLTDARNCKRAMNKGAVEDYMEYLALHPKGSCAARIQKKLDDTMRREEEDLDAKREALRKQEEELQRRQTELQRQREEAEQRRRDDERKRKEDEERRRQEEQRTAALPVPPAPQPTGRSFIIYQGTDLYGGDYGRMPGKVGYQACVSACRADLRCRAFTYNSQAQVCFLKSTVPPAKPFQFAISGVLRSSGQPVVRPAAPTPAPVQTSGACGGGFSTFDNSDFFGNDIGGYNTSFQGCRQLCLGKRSCRGFSWIKKKVTKRCWLKYALAAPSTNYKVVSCRRN